MHIADVHLGYQQYRSPVRFDDFGKAFQTVAEYAIEQAVNFVLIAGDLFHKSSIDPSTLLQAVHVLRTLRDANIQVVTIAGNHDSARSQAGASWLDFLAETKHLVVLSPDYSGGELCLQQWNGYEGAYIDLGAIRVFGVPYLGAGLNPLLKDLPMAIEAVQDSTSAYTILLAHAGLEGEMPRVAGGLAHTDITPLRPHVNYLALGHLHKPFERDGWVYNPGSLEVCDVDEARWHGGCYHVQVFLDGSEPKHTARHIKSQRRRPFHRILFEVDGCDTPAALYDALRVKLQERQKTIATDELAPVVEVTLTGVLDFDRAQLDLDYVRDLTSDLLSPLLVRPRNRTRPSDFEIKPEDRMSRRELEQTVFRELALRDGRYRAQAEEWGALMAEVKQMVLARQPAEMIAATIRQQMEALAGTEAEAE
jgi:DNA repair exonuclease SbcCD nuclease subunit